MKLMMIAFLSMILLSSGGLISQEASAADKEVIILDLELGTSLDSKPLRIMTLDGETAEVTVTPDPSGRSGESLTGSLKVRPVLTDAGIEIHVLWSSLENSEPTEFRMRVLEGEPSSIASSHENGDALQVGVVAQRATARERETLVSNQAVEGQLSGSTNCGYQSCGGSTWACCGVCAICDVGCGWFGPVCQVP